MADLLFDVKDGIATITLNRPEARNAFSLEMIQLWEKALIEVRNNDAIRVLLVTGAGTVFCAGGDLKSMQEGRGFLHLKEEEEADFVSTGMNRKNSVWKNVHRIPLLMDEIDKPTIAVINGDAIGAGLDMTLQCDFRFTSDQAKLGEGYIKAALVPGDGGGFYLPRLVGLDKALELLLTGRIVDAKEAYEMGLVTRVSSAENVMADAMKFAEALSNGPQEAIRFTKRTVYQGLKTDLRTSLDTVSSFMGLVTEHEDYQEGVQAIIERRKPKFK